MSLLVITISFNFSPLKDITIGGIIVVKNISGEPCEIVEPVAVKKSGDGKEMMTVSGVGERPQFFRTLHARRW